MSSFARIPLMICVSLLVLAFCAGGSRNVVEGLVWVTFICGLPLIGLIGWLDHLERRSDPQMRYVIAAIGLIPLGLVIFLGGSGEYAGVIILAGMAWSAAWLVTSGAFSRAVAVPPTLPRSYDSRD